MKRNLLFLALFAFLPMMASVAFAQDENDSIVPQKKVKYVDGLTLCPQYGVDTRIVMLSDNINQILDSIQRKNRRYLGPQAEWCNTQKENVISLINTLNLDYKREGQIIWLNEDHTLAINNAETLLRRLEELEITLEELADDIENEVMAQEEQERRWREDSIQKAQEKLRQAKIDRLNNYKDTIRTMSRDIIEQLAFDRIPEKAKRNKVKALNTSYYDVHGTFDLTSDNPTEEYFALLEQYKTFEKEMLDSIVEKSPSSLIRSYEKFNGSFQTRFSKSKPKIARAYTSAFKNVEPKYSFKTLEGFQKFKQYWRDMNETQQAYVTSISLIDSIELEHKNLQEACAGKLRRVYDSYRRTVYDMMSPHFIPHFTDKAGADKHLDFLRNQIYLILEYDNAIDRIQEVEARNDSIINLCPSNSPLGTIGYNFEKLADGKRYTTFTPSFTDKKGADAFNNGLLDFEEVQSCYIQCIAIRKGIDSTNNVIKENKKKLRKDVFAGYKKLYDKSDLTPNFASEAAGKDCIRTLNRFIEVQNNMMQITENDQKIAQNDDNIQNHKFDKKLYKNIISAYKTLMGSDEYMFTIPVEDATDIQEYLRFQKKVLAMQQKFLDMDDYNDMNIINGSLKKEKKNVNKIKEIMNIN